MERMWINQPSTIQTCHSMHGTNVLADLKSAKKDDVCVTVYFVSGDVISAYIPKLALSMGWRK